MNIRTNINNITAIPALCSWIYTHQIDTTNNLQRIFQNAAALANLLQNITINSANHGDFTQKLFLTLLNILENKSPDAPRTDAPQEAIPQYVPRGLPASYAIPLKKLKKYVLVKDIRAALDLHVNKGGPTRFAHIDQAQVIELISLVASSLENRILLNEKQLALLVQLVFSPVRELMAVLVTACEESEPEEFEHEVGDEKAQAVIRLNTKVPSEVVELSTKIFGEQRAAALINLFNCWSKSQLYSIPAITNSLLLIPFKFVNILSTALIAFGWEHFNHYNLENELDIIYKMVLTSNEKYLKKFIYALTWPMKHRIHSGSNSLNILACKDFIEYFPELDVELRKVTCQRIFDLIIHHMQACERLYNIQNQYIFQLLNDERVIESNLGSDVNYLICEHISGLDTQGFFAKKYLRQMPEDEHLDLQNFLGNKLK